jgi:hypothetical protein
MVASDDPAVLFATRHLGALRYISGTGVDRPRLIRQRPFHVGPRLGGTLDSNHHRSDHLSPSTAHLRDDSRKQRGAEYQRDYMATQRGRASERIEFLDDR